MKLPFFVLVALLYVTSVSAYTANDVLWIPKYDSSSSGDESQLSDFGNGTTATFSHNVMVTDEFSVVFRAAMQSNDSVLAKTAYNTIDIIESSSHPGGLVWINYRNGNTITSGSGSNDTATDADANVIVGLAVGSRNTHFSLSDRALYAQAGNAMCNAFVANNLHHQSFTGTAGDYEYIVAAGPGAKSGGLASIPYTYTGYAGVVLEALTECYVLNNSRTINGDTFLVIAQNVSASYLSAFNFNGTDISVPGKAYSYENSTGGDVFYDGDAIVAVCKEDCDPFDYYDAPRVTFLCRAQAKAEAQSLDLGLTEFCEYFNTQDLNFSDGFAPQRHPDLSASGNEQAGYYETAIGLPVHYWNETEVDEGVTRIFNSADRANKRFYGDNFFGTFKQSYAVVAACSAVGREGDALTSNGFEAFGGSADAACYELVSYWTAIENNNSIQFIVEEGSQEPGESDSSTSSNWGVCDSDKVTDLMPIVLILGLVVVVLIVAFGSSVSFFLWPVFMGFVVLVVAGLLACI